MNDYSILVNKDNKLPDNYIPDDLIIIDKDFSLKGMARKEASYAFIKMAKDALKENLHIINTSAYRSFERQKYLFDLEIAKKQDKALAGIAKPGYSEHQTGLAFDLCTDKYDMYNFYKSKEFTWMLKNSYKYGFILRYPYGMETKTGYKYEPWHYRYLGVDLATKVYESKLTYDEYYKKNLL